MSRGWKHTRTTTQRGYGYTHRQLRNQWKPRVEAGQVICWRCRTRIPPHAEWVLGHDPNDRRFYRGPEHKACSDGSAWADRHPTPATPMAVAMFFNAKR